MAAVVYGIVAFSVLRWEDYRAAFAVGSIGFVLHLLELVRSRASLGQPARAFLWLNMLLPLAVLCLALIAWRSAGKSASSGSGSQSAGPPD